MKINTFKAFDVHGYLNFNIEFFPDLNFLIGINGSGKTSVLKLILGLTIPSFTFLNQISFKECEVICSSTDFEKDILIHCKQNSDTISINLNYKGEKYTSKNIRRFLNRYVSHYDIDEIKSIEQRYKEEFESLDVVKKIRDIATPTFLGLDRRIEDGISSDFRLKRQRIFNNTKNRIRNSENYSYLHPIDVSLDEVQKLIYDYTRSILQRQYIINDEFKQIMFNQSFEFIEENDNLSEIAQFTRPDYLNERKEKVLLAIENLGISNLTSIINKFFKKLYSVAEEIEGLTTQKEGEKKSEKKILETFSQWFQNGSQLKRIDDIIKYSQHYQDKVEELRAPIKKLEILVENFLKEGKKRLKIEDDGEIKLIINDSIFSNIYGLSSGEKQIIIMIAYLIFEEAQKTSGIFIIDEPELSLHIAWQEIFVQSIMEASPNTQFILATHSPSIIAKVDREKNCQDLNKLNF